MVQRAEPQHSVEGHHLIRANMPQTSSSTTTTSTLSEAADDSSSEDDTTPSPSLLDKFDWDGMPFETLRSCIEPMRRHPKWTEEHAEEYTGQVLQQRQSFIRRVAMENPYRLPSVLRYTACYEYFLKMAQSEVYRQTQMLISDCDSSEAESKLEQQACRQLLLFDRVQDHGPNPCDFPPNQVGNVYLSSAVILLRYTIYTRYRHYAGRVLDSLNFPVRPVFKKIWKRASIRLVKESTWLAEKRKNQSQVEESEHGNIIMHSVMYRINQQLRLRALTTERAIESLEKYARHRHRSGCWMGTAATEVRTFELENMVRRGDHQTLAEVLCSDFVTLDCLKRFEQDDLELAHLQAVVLGLAEIFFDVKEIRKGRDENISNWTPSPLFWHQQNQFRRDNIERFSGTLQWSLRVRSEIAEERFGNAWIALWEGQGREKKLVQELLAGYLESLGVESAVPIPVQIDEEGAAVVDELCNDSPADDSSRIE